MPAELPDETLGTIQKAASHSHDGTTVVLVFGTVDFVELLLNWAIAAMRAGVTWFVLVAMDMQLHSMLCPPAATTDAVGHERCDHVVLLPRTVDGSVRITKLNVIGERQRFGVRVLERGISVVHADADALLLRDPAPLLRDGDIVASRIWGKPRSVIERWGAGICTGFYMLRSTPAVIQAARAVEAAVQARARKHSADWQTSDQLFINTVLAGQRVEWEGGAKMPPLEDYKSRMYSTERAVARVQNGSHSLRLVMLPHMLVPRACPVIQETDPPRGKVALLRHLFSSSYVLHCFPPNSDPPPGERLVHMGHPRHTSAEVRFEQSHGLWRLAPGWRSVSRGSSLIEWLRRIDTPPLELVVASVRPLLDLLPPAVGPSLSKP